MIRCTDLFLGNCWWRNKYFPCCDIFDLQKCEYGLCFSFNSATNDAGRFKVVWQIVYNNLKSFLQFVLHHRRNSRIILGERTDMDCGVVYDSNWMSPLCSIIPSRHYLPALWWMYITLINGQTMAISFQGCPPLPSWLDLRYHTQRKMSTNWRKVSGFASMRLSKRYYPNQVIQMNLIHVSGARWKRRQQQYTAK